MFTRVLLLFLLCSQSSFAADNSYSREFDGSDVSGWFFGPAKTTQEKKTMALNIGRIGIKFEPSLNCGKMNFKASVNAGVDNLKGQLSALTGKLSSMLEDTGSLSIAVICYMQKNLCSHMRNFSATIQRELKFQFNACQAVDNLITGGSESNQRRLKATAVSKCVKNGGKLDDCREQGRGRSRNLLSPYSNSVATGEQKVLKSLLSVVKKVDNYDIWTKLLGETKLSIKGEFSSFFPKDLLKPEDFAHNIEVSSRKTSCDIEKLDNIISNRHRPSTDVFSKHLIVVIQDKLPKSIIFDLESLPSADLASACQSLGDSLAAISLKKITAEGRSDLTAALANDALPPELKNLYQNRSDKTFQALEKRISANEIRPLSENLAMIHKLAREYRRINKKEASGITARRAINRANKEECVDQLSCERGSR